MLNPYKLLLAMADQMYVDVRFIAEQNPKEVVDSDTTGMYNALLGRVREAYQGLPFLDSFQDLNARTLKYKDMVIVVGQLRSLLNLLADDRSRLDEVMETFGGEDGGADAPGPGQYDQELYGDSPPPALNEDGTIPFTLDEVEAHARRRSEATDTAQPEQLAGPTGEAPIDDSIDESYEDEEAPSR